MIKETIIKKAYSLRYDLKNFNDNLLSKIESKNILVMAAEVP